MDDDLYETAVMIVSDSHRASTSLLQRRMRIGYGRAESLLERMEKDGIVGPFNGMKPRQFLEKESRESCDSQNQL